MKIGSPFENDGVLPIGIVKHIIVTGRTCRRQGASSVGFYGDKESVVTVTDGIRNNAPSGVTVEFCWGFDTSDSESGLKEMIKSKKNDFIIWLSRKRL